MPAGSILVLKLVDSRLSRDLRKFYEVPDLTSNHANEYRKSSQRHSKTYEEWEAKIEELEKEHQELAPLEKEAHPKTLLYSYYKCETKCTTS
jgi:hypothetical protein